MLFKQQKFHKKIVNHTFNLRLETREDSQLPSKHFLYAHLPSEQLVRLVLQAVGPQLSSSPFVAGFCNYPATSHLELFTLASCGFIL